MIHRCDGQTFARVDFLFEDHGIVIEVSGRKGHSSPSERARDAQRRNELQDGGRRVYEYTWEDDHPTGRMGRQDTIGARLGAAQRRSPIA